jgi:hypothetical protein
MEQAKDDREHVPEAPSGPLPPLERLGDFRILRAIGHGGMGVVYEAEQVSLGRHVALKVLPAKRLADAHTKQRFEREARAAARLHHTNIVPVFAIGEHEGMPYYVMQYIQGLGLDQVLEELKRLQPVGHVANVPDGQRHAGHVPPRKVSAADVARSLLTGDFVLTTGGAIVPADGLVGPVDQAGGSTTGRASPTSACRWPRPSTTPTARGFSTATSSRPTYCSTRRAPSG